MKLLKTNNIATVKACRYYFKFELPCVVLTERTDKFEPQFNDSSNLFCKVCRTPVIVNWYFLCVLVFYVYSVRFISFCTQ